MTTSTVDDTTKDKARSLAFPGTAYNDTFFTCATNEGFSDTTVFEFELDETLADEFVRTEVAEEGLLVLQSIVNRHNVRRITDRERILDKIGRG